MLVRGVVGYQVDDELESELMDTILEGVEIGEGTEDRVDIAVVGDVVSGILLRRGVER